MDRSVPIPMDPSPVAVSKVMNWRDMIAMVSCLNNTSHWKLKMEACLHNSLKIMVLIFNS